MKAREAFMDKIKVRLKSCDMRSARKRGTKKKQTKKTHTHTKTMAGIPTKRSNSGQATLVGAEDSAFAENLI